MSITEYLLHLEQLVGIDSGSGFEPGIEAVVCYLEALAKKSQFFTKRERFAGGTGPGLLISNYPDPERFDLLFIGHSDTVFEPGTAAKRPFFIQDHRAYGPGVADMKGGLLLIVALLQSLPTAVHAKLRLGLLVTPDEEVGSRASKAWLTHWIEHSQIIFVTEAARENNASVSERKGSVLYELHCQGRAAHAGNDIDQGASAIDELAHWLVALKQFHEGQQGTTVNIGKLRGGTQANIVAESASAVIDCRFWDVDVRSHLTQWIAERIANPYIPDVQVTLEELSYKAVMRPDLRTKRVMRCLEACAEAAEFTLKWSAVGGGSDANLAAALGAVVLDGFGPAGGKFHTVDEFIDLTSIAPRLKMLSLFCEELLIPGTIDHFLAPGRTM